MKKLDLVIIIPFLMFIFTFGLLYFFTPDIEFSESENKYLEQMPEISAENIISGEFETDFETYLSDQFAGRDFWVSANTTLLITALRRDVNGVYIGSDGYLLEVFDSIDTERYEKHIAALNKFASYTDVPIFLAIAPTSVSVMSDKLPAFAPNASQTEYISGFYEGLDDKIKAINISDVLTLYSNDYIYYRTDHHWTTYGAYLAFNAIAGAMRLETAEDTEVTATTVSESFLGTLYSKGNFLVSPDSIQRFDYNSPVKYTVTYDDGSVSDSLYDSDYLTAKDKYGYFASGNPAHLIVETEAGTGKTLVILKDSYMHCMLPFFTKYYDTIHMLDPRYINTNLTDYISELNPDEILILYNAKTLSDDVNFLKLGFTPKDVQS